MNKANPDALLELAERIEATSGPDRYLDSYIWVAIGGADNAGTPLYTASLDAAMSLVPEGFHIAQMGEMRYIASDRPWVVQLDDWQGGEHRFGTRKQGLGKTAALALCTAALRAQAQQQDK